MSDLFKNLSFKCNEGMSGYRSEYLSSIKEVYRVITNHNLLRSYINEKDYAKSESLLRFSLVFNDLSLLTWTKSKELEISILETEWFKHHFDSELVHILAHSDH